MNKTEKERWKKFKGYHYENCYKDIHTGTIGVNICHYIVYETSVGKMYKAVCDICGEERDITDFDTW